MALARTRDGFATAEPDPRRAGSAIRREQAAAGHESYRLPYGALLHEHDIEDLTCCHAADWHQAIEIVETLFDALTPD